MLMSPVEEVDGVRFSKMPNKPFKPQKVVRVGTTIAMLLENGKVCTNRDTHKWAYPTSVSSWPWMPDLTEALYRLGSISQAAMKEHLAICKDRDEKRSRKDAAEYLVRYAAELGVELTAEQRKLVKSAENIFIKAA